VNAQGTIPPNTTEHCSVLVASPDDASFQFLIYGGWNFFGGAGGHVSGQETAYNHVYILTIPSFQWINVTDSNNTEAINLHGGGKNTQCLAYKDRQMIVLGGDFSTESPNGNWVQVTGCNTSVPAIRVLDTTTFTWQKQFSSSASTYQVPQPVIDVIGGR
jgi:hypothetical protein